MENEKETAVSLRKEYLKIEKKREAFVAKLQTEGVERVREVMGALHELDKEQIVKDESENQQDDDFGVGLTINELIAHLECIRTQYGNLHVGVRANKSGQWYGLLDGPTVQTVDKNEYKSCYVIGSKETIVIFD